MIIAEAVGPTSSVLAIECDEGLAARSRANLRAWPHVNIVTGDGATFDLGEFDVGYINAGASRLMPRWLAGLRPGGRLLVPLTVDPSMSAGGYTLLVTRTGERWSARFTGFVAIYPCDGARDTTCASCTSSRSFAMCSRCGAIRTSAKRPARCIWTTTASRRCRRILSMCRVE